MNASEVEDTRTRHRCERCGYAVHDNLHVCQHWPDDDTLAALQPPTVRHCSNGYQAVLPVRSGRRLVATVTSCRRSWLCRNHATDRARAELDHLIEVWRDHVDHHHDPTTNTVTVTERPVFYAYIPRFGELGDDDQTKIRDKLKDRVKKLGGASQVGRLTIESTDDTLHVLASVDLTCHPPDPIEFVPLPHGEVLDVLRHSMLCPGRVWRTRRDGPWSPTHKPRSHSAPTSPAPPEEPRPDVRKLRAVASRDDFDRALAETCDFISDRHGVEVEVTDGVIPETVDLALFDRTFNIVADRLRRERVGVGSWDTDPSTLDLVLEPA